MNEPAFRCLVLSDFNSQNLCGYLNHDASPPRVHAEAGPYGQVIEPLLDASHPCWAERPGVVLVWTRPETAVPSFGRLLEFQPGKPEQAIAEVDRYARHLLRLADRATTVFVPTWVLPPPYRGLGMLDLKHPAGAARTLLEMNARLAANLSEAPGFYVLDAQRWIALAGPKSCNPQLWYMGKIPFAPAVFREAAADLKAALAGLRGAARKLLILDLDDTLWGGIVGEVGWQHLRLGGHDPVGEAFADFQRAIRALKNRGVILGIVSKNDQHLALEAIASHPEMVLRLEDFAGWRINWRDKAQNILELVEELNLGPQAAVYIDDDAGQRQRIRGALPEVFVPDWPADKLLYRQALESLRCFDAPELSQEDRTRAEMYARDRQRRQCAASFQSVDEWLEDLEIRVDVEALSQDNLPRAAQLLNKTNQMNLTTRRMTAQELWHWSQQPQHRLWTFRVRDRFGDCGLVGIASLEWSGDQGTIVDFVLSCRAFGRRIEEAMMHVLLRHARTLALRRVEARYLPTARNAPCLEFFAGTSGFRREVDDTFHWDLEKDYLAPAAIQLVQ